MSFHHAEIISIDGESYRKREAEQAQKRKQEQKSTVITPPLSLRLDDTDHKLDHSGTPSEPSKLLWPPTVDEEAGGRDRNEAQ